MPFVLRWLHDLYAAGISCEVVINYHLPLSIVSWNKVPLNWENNPPFC